MMNEILWPKKYLPGTTDNFVSNEKIIKDMTAEEVWKYLNNTSMWPKYYNNSSDIHFYNISGPNLATNARFRFNTFGFRVEAEVLEYIPPINGNLARVAWHGWSGETEDTKLDVYHAWLIENISEGRVRILTQESQIGKPAKELAQTKPNPMINGHQDWLDGLVNATKTNLK